MVANMFRPLLWSSSGWFLWEQKYSYISNLSESLHRIKKTISLVVKIHWIIIFFIWRDSSPPPHWARVFSFTRFLYHIQRRTTVGMTPLDEWSACRRDPYLTTHNTHNRQTSNPPVGFKPTISAGERPQTHALDRAATGTGNNKHILNITVFLFSKKSSWRWTQEWPKRVGDHNTVQAHQQS
jgi:hypothetical protein